MTNRLKLEKINESIKTLNDAIDKQTKELIKLEEQSSELIIKIFEEEALLNNTSWELIASSPNRVHLSYDESSGSLDDLLSKFKLLFGKTQSSWVDLEEGVELHIDNLIEIHFDEARMILPFVNKHKVKITNSNVVDKLQRLKRDSSALEQIAHQFALKK